MIIKNKIYQRRTHQREAILSYLKNTSIHPTAEALYSQIKKSIPTISLATVYRNLHWMANIGKIRRNAINNEYHFESKTEPHHHCICKKCGAIIDFHNIDISYYAMVNLKSKIFKPDSVDISYLGLCEKCKAEGATDD